MKIQHWAIIFIIIILPFSIIARNTINKKIALIKEETRYNNIVDNASYDAVSQILELSEELELSKNVPITKQVAEAAIDRFFNTLAVNFNLPVVKSKTDSTVNSAKSYFSQYIPAIIIVGYDGLYVCSYEQTNSGFEYTLKPKVPYSCAVDNGIINFTLDDYVEIYFDNLTFKKGMKNDITGQDETTNVLKGYVGRELDYNDDNIDDFRDKADLIGDPPSYELNNKTYYTVYSWKGNSSNEAYEDIDRSNDDPFNVADKGGLPDDMISDNHSTIDYIKQYLPTYTDNVSYILYELDRNGDNDVKRKFRFLIDVKDTDLNPNSQDYAVGGETLDKKTADQVHFSNVSIDYEYNDDGSIKVEASQFNKLRRETIVGLIQAVLRQEFNEHNQFADAVGMTYDFTIPDFGWDQWNNTVDDISVLAFIQGMPMGYESYYNNYSLGGARIVKKENLVGETIEGHKVYHKPYCPCIPRDVNGKIVHAEYDSERGIYKLPTDVEFSNEYNQMLLPSGGFRSNFTSGILEEFTNESQAHRAGYYACSECM